jgi:hypothetical protein
LIAKLSAADLQRAAAYVRQVLSVPYAEGAAGPDAFDCWGLTRDCQKTLFSRELPIIGSEALQDVLRIVSDPSVRATWPEIAQPVHGALTVLKNTRRRHVGTWLMLDGGGLLHTVEGAGPRFDSRLMLRQTGWYGIRFHDYAETRS